MWQWTQLLEAEDGRYPTAKIPVWPCSWLFRGIWQGAVQLEWCCWTVIQNDPCLCIWPGSYLPESQTCIRYYFWKKDSACSVMYVSSKYLCMYFAASVVYITLLLAALRPCCHLPESGLLLIARRVERSMNPALCNLQVLRSISTSHPASRIVAEHQQVAPCWGDDTGKQL